MFGFVFGLLFEALPPEVNSGNLAASPGPLPLHLASDAYDACYNALTIAAAANEGSMAQASQTWSSEGADKAQAAFRAHTDWMRSQADIALHTSMLMGLAAAANAEAVIAMPSLATIAAVHAAAAAAAATGSMAVAAPVVAASEAAYMALWHQAAATMTTYAGQAFSAMSELKPPLPAPPIAAGTPAGAAPDAIATALQAGLAALGGGMKAAVPGSAPGGAAAGGSGAGGSGGGADASGAGSGAGGGSGAGTGDSGPGLPSGSDPAGTQGLPDSAPVSDAFGTGGTGDASISQDAGLYGAAPTSPTLDGLNGGVGSAVTLSMSRGGIGAMPGAATGFRMPANWNPASAQAFGAGIGNPAAAQPIPQRTVPKGASAPQTLRRRRDQEEKRPSKAIAISDAGPVPELEQATGLGVIEYADADDSPLTASEQLLVPGVLGVDSWDE